VTLAFVGVWLVAILIWCILFRYSTRLLADVRNGVWSEPLIKQVIVRYDNCKKLDLMVHNVDVFVEKIIENDKKCGFTIRQWGLIANSLEYVALLAGIASLLTEYQQSKQAGFIAILILGAILILHELAHLWSKKMILRTLIVELADYLENSTEIREQACVISKLHGESANEFAKLRKNYKKIQESVHMHTI